MSVPILENKLKEIDLDNLYYQIKLSGSELTKVDLKNKLNKILNNLEKVMNNYFLNISDDKVEHNYFKPIDNILFSFNKTVNEIDPNSIIKYNKENFFEQCLNLLEECLLVSFSNEIYLLLEGELKIENTNYQFVGTEFKIKNKFKHDNIRFKLKKLGNSEIYFEDGIELQIDNENKIVNINQQIPGSRIYIIGGFLENFAINFSVKK